MQISDTTNETGIVQDIYFNSGSNSNSFPIADVIRAVNKGLDRVTTLILKADARWQFDDLNKTTLPIATTNIVSAQKDYSFDSSFLEVLKVLVADSNGNFKEIYNIDIYDQTVGNYLTNPTSNTGTPARYDVMGGSIILDPVPDYNYTNGLKVYFKRKAEYFTSTDTIKEPGFASHFHPILSLYGQYEYANAKGLANQEKLKRDILEMETDLIAFYSRRLKDYKPTLIPRIRNYE